MTDKTTTPEPQKINYRSDFVAVLELADAAGKPIPFPDCDFEAVFWTGNANRKYAISRRGDVLTNCRREPGGGIRAIFDHHGMGVGELKWEPQFRLPNGEFPDGYQDVMRPMPLNIILVSGPGDLPSAASIAITLPYIKGERGESGATGPQGPQGEPGQKGDKGDKGDSGKPFTYGDFTPEQLEGLRGPQGNSLTYDDLTPGQIAELQRPATEAAQLVSSVIDAATATNNAITEAEQSRVEAEQSRVEAEQSRVEAEQERAREFAGFAQDIDRASKQCFIDLFNTAAGPCGKYDPDNAPDADHPFLCNELWLTYEEAMIVYEYRVTTHHDFYERCYDPGFASRTKLLRTVLSPIYTQYGETLDLTRFVCSCTNVEILNISTNTAQRFNIGPCDDAFKDCSSLREVHPSLIFTKLSSYGQNTIPFRGCSSLERLFAEFRVNAYLQDCPKLSLASVEYIASHSSAGVTVTVHPDVYAKLTGDITNAAAAALTADELAQWQQVCIDAIQKNISFATI